MSGPGGPVSSVDRFRWWIGEDEHQAAGHKCAVFLHARRVRGSAPRRQEAEGKRQKGSREQGTGGGVGKAVDRQWVASRLVSSRSVGTRNPHRAVSCVTTDRGDTPRLAAATRFDRLTARRPGSRRGCSVTCGRHCRTIFARSTQKGRGGRVATIFAEVGNMVGRWGLGAARLLGAHLTELRAIGILTCVGAGDCPIMPRTWVRGHICSCGGWGPGFGKSPALRSS
jgi:hypothetical protein